MIASAARFVEPRALPGLPGAGRVRDPPRRLTWVRTRREAPAGKRSRARARTPRAATRPRRRAARRRRAEARPADAPAGLSAAAQRAALGPRGFGGAAGRMSAGKPTPSEAQAILTHPRHPGAPSDSSRGSSGSRSTSRPWAASRRSCSSCSSPRSCPAARGRCRRSPGRRRRSPTPCPTTAARPCRSPRPSSASSSSCCGPRWASWTTRARWAPSEQQRYIAGLKREQMTLRSGLEARGVVFRDVVSYYRVWNGFAATVRRATSRG